MDDLRGARHADFAKIVEIFDAHGASFVSITQQFNTTTASPSIALSFAQFEREVTSERIRHKIAASKRKGLWLGGYVPLGHEPDGRTLVINEGFSGPGDARRGGRTNVGSRPTPENPERIFRELGSSIPSGTTATAAHRLRVAQMPY